MKRLKPEPYRPDVSPLQGWAMDRRPQGETWHWFRITGKALCSRAYHIGPVCPTLPRDARPCQQCLIRLQKTGR